METKKALILENIDELENLLSTYLKEEKFEYDVLYRLGFSLAKDSDTEYQQKIFKFLTQKDYTHLIVQSSFGDTDQMLKLMGMLVKYKDQISFREIRIMYLYPGHFENFINKSYEKDEVFRTLFNDLYKVYSIYGIESATYEIPSKTKTYFKELKFIYDTIKLSKYFWSDNSVSYIYERSPILDDKKDLRSFSTYFISEVEMKKLDNIRNKFKLLKKKNLDDFFNELTAMLEYQEDIILSDKTCTDHDYNLKCNKENQEILFQLKKLF